MAVATAEGAAAMAVAGTVASWGEEVRATAAAVKAWEAVARAVAEAVAAVAAAMSAREGEGSAAVARCSVPRTCEGVRGG